MKGRHMSMKANKSNCPLWASRFNEGYRARYTQGQTFLNQTNIETPKSQNADIPSGQAIQAQQAKNCRRSYGELAGNCLSELALYQLDRLTAPSKQMSTHIGIV